MTVRHRIPELSPEGRAAAQALRHAVAGEVSASPLRRWLYSTDASGYRVVPELVVVAGSPDDLAIAATVAAETGLPLVARGAASSLAGQAIGPGIVVDCFGLDRILEIDAGARRARVQPGVVQAALNAAAVPLGLEFGRRHLDRRPGDHRRHGRQQLVRRALDRLRREQGQGAARGRRARRRRDRHVRCLRRGRPRERHARGGGGEARGGARAGARAIPRAHRHRLPADGPLHLRLQPQGAARALAEPRPAARRLRGHAGAVRRARRAP